MGDRLGPYRAKRDFDSTPEPAPAEAAGEDLNRYVVQEHHARSMHWDLRLEREGTLASWAVPKGIPPDPQRNHLAVRTEDHPLGYLEFHGDIPEGEYGAGTMKIWDQGTYELHKWRADEVMVTFHGERLEGRYVLFRTGGKNWMIHRMDPPQDAGREPMPERIAPMLARSGPLPPDDGRWAYEVKWDGVRAIGHGEGGRLRLASPHRHPPTPRDPETATTSRRATRSCASSGGRSARARPSSTARSSPSGPTASRASSGCRAACTWPPRVRCAGWRPPPRSPT
jgi:bifunctional non-homologous end joining protein LigD